MAMAAEPRRQLGLLRRDFDRFGIDTDAGFISGLDKDDREQMARRVSQTLPTWATTTSRNFA
jgi:hypothetical protein